MATVHRTTMAPTKLELLEAWLPRQPWYVGDGTADLTWAGGFRLDDPAGEVGLEYALVSDGGSTYSVPMSYRAAPLEGAENALLGTSEHGVLGTRWIYDAEHDPVAVQQLLAFVAGEAEAQNRSQSDTPDPTVGRSWTGEGRPASVDWVRVLPGAESPAPGRVDVDWTQPDGTTTRGTVALVR